uniref:FXYD domain-containing ion transport regulator n=1 Tax=Podarcis muralis TaxID=64176 RepID=A0A670JDP7_PODMU
CYQITITLFVFFCSIPCPGDASILDKTKPLLFPPADWYSLRVGGLIVAGVLCFLGIVILLSKQNGFHCDSTPIVTATVKSF